MSSRSERYCCVSSMSFSVPRAAPYASYRELIDLDGRAMGLNAGVDVSDGRPAIVATAWWSPGKSSDRLPVSSAASVAGSCALGKSVAEAAPAAAQLRGPGGQKLLERLDVEVVGSVVMICIAALVDVSAGSDSFTESACLQET